MNLLLWFLQILFGIYFTAVGLLHFILPEGLPAQMGWMYDLPASLHYISGTAEILGGLGLILPGISRIPNRYTPMAAAGLVLVMLGAVLYHLPRGESQNMVFNLVIAALMGFVAYGRWRVSPLKEQRIDRGAA